MSENQEKETKVLTEINKYVSNTDKNIYTISGIPEEVVAVIFAYVSRSNKSFRENISTVIAEENLGQERASKFHEKWVLNYGHGSVAEHATLHIGIEKVSRLFSSLLELSNEYLSFTEYSQRYQKPKRGDFYIPIELDSKPQLHSDYIALNNFLYDTYTNINSKLFEYLKNQNPAPNNVNEKKIYITALEKKAFEDARYALSLATYTNLGMTGNARAIEDMLTKLLSCEYTEAANVATEIKAEAKNSTPTLIKYAKPNSYLGITPKILREKSQTLLSQNINSSFRKNVRLLDWTGKYPENIVHNAEYNALNKIFRAILFEYSNLSHETIENIIEKQDGTFFKSSESYKRKYELIAQAVENLGKHTQPLNPFKLIRYEAEFTISEACWHQFLRHRKINWIFQYPSVTNGVTIPPNIAESDTEDLLRQAIQKSEELYQKLMNENLTLTAHYVVTNAHNRRVLGSFDLWELYHLINLRLSEAAQWDIKNTVQLLVEEIKKHHPNLILPALARIQKS